MHQPPMMTLIAIPFAKQSTYLYKLGITLYRAPILIVSVHPNEKVAGELEAKPTAGHTRRYLQEVRHNAFVESANPLLCDDYRDRVPY